MAPLGRWLGIGYAFTRRQDRRSTEESLQKEGTMPELTTMITGDGALLLFSAAGLFATAVAILRDIPAQRQVVTRDSARAH